MKTREIAIGYSWQALCLFQNEVWWKGNHIRMSFCLSCLILFFLNLFFYWLIEISGWGLEMRRRIKGDLRSLSSLSSLSSLRTPKDIQFDTKMYLYNVLPPSLIHSSRHVLAEGFERVVCLLTLSLYLLPENLATGKSEDKFITDSKNY